MCEPLMPNICRELDCEIYAQTREVLSSLYRLKGCAASLSLYLDYKIPGNYLGTSIHEHIPSIFLNEIFPYFKCFECC